MRRDPTPTAFAAAPDSWFDTPPLGALEAALHAAADGVVLTDARQVICYTNRAFERITGYPAHEIVGMRPTVLRSGRQTGSFYRRMWAAIARDGQWSGLLWNRCRDGRVAPHWNSISTVHDSRGVVTHYLCVMRDLTGQPGLAAVLNAEGRDEITGLMNRAGFITAAARAFGEYRASSITVLSADIAGFSELNERFGTTACDQLLTQFARRLEALHGPYPEALAIGRVGADEFAVALPGAQTEGGVRAYADAVHGLCREPFELEGQALQLSLQVGMACDEADTAHAHELLIKAAVARADARQVHQPTRAYIGRDAERAMAVDLRAALHRGEVHVAYQPKVCLDDGRVCGAEALARWTRDDGTVVSPGVFIPVAERHGLIAELGDVVLHRSLADLAALRQQGLVLPSVAVNLSARQFHRGQLAQQVSAALLTHGIDAGSLELELTESILLGDVPDVLATIHALRERGVQLSIDDFGTGYSSLAYLRSLPVHRIKVDQSFVRTMGEDRGAREIVRAIIDVSHSLGLCAVAEGVETVDQLRALRELGCDQAQGYLFARPLPPAELARLLGRPLAWLSAFGAPAAAAA